MNSTVKTVVFWVLIATCLIVLWHVVESGVGMGKDQEVPFSKFMSDAQTGQIADVTVVGNEVHGHYRTGKENFHSTVPSNYPDMYKVLEDHQVSVTIKDSQGSAWFNILLQLSPILLLGALWFFMLRQMQTGGNKAMSFGKSKAPLLSHATEKSDIQRCCRGGGSEGRVKGDH